MEVIVTAVAVRVEGLVEAAAGRTLSLQLLLGDELVSETDVDPTSGFATSSLIAPVAVPIADGQPAEGGAAMAAAVSELCRGLRFQLCAISVRETEAPSLEVLSSGAAEGLGVGEKGPVGVELEGVCAARLNAYYRVVVQLPSLLAEREPPLALKYGGAANRREMVGRWSQWREEMCATAVGCDNPGLGASLRWDRAPPVKPSRTLGDATTRRVQAELAVATNEDRVAMSRQAVQRDYDQR